MSASRPMTHDLMRDLISHLNARLERIVITEIKDETFHSLLWLRQGDEPVAIDAGLLTQSHWHFGPIAHLRLRTGNANRQDEYLRAGRGPERGAVARTWLEGLNDEDLGRYKM